jgi:hypothetical protein
MYGSLTTLILIFAAFVQRGRSEPEVRFENQRTGFILVSIATVCIHFWAFFDRGPSNASVLMGVFAVLHSILTLLLTTHSKRILDRARPEFRDPNPRLGRVFTYGAIVSCLATLVPLNFLGLLATDPPAKRFADAISIGLAKPLKEQSDLDLDQCLIDKKVDESNIKVPCSYPHAAQVVRKVSSAKDCPSTEIFKKYDRILTMRTVEGNDGFIYCVVMTATTGVLTGKLLETENQLAG